MAGRYVSCRSRLDESTVYTLVYPLWQHGGGRCTLVGGVPNSADRFWVVQASPMAGRYVSCRSPLEASTVYTLV